MSSHIVTPSTNVKIHHPKRESEYLLSERASLQLSQTQSPLISPKQKAAPRCLISVLSPAKMWWDAMVLCLAVWNCFYVPFSIAFITGEEPMPFYVANLFIDAAYLADIVVYMRSTYIDLQTGEEVTNIRKITKKYVYSSRFVVDVLSGVPFDVISNTTGKFKEIQLIGIVKVLRLLRLRRLLMFMQTKAQVKLTLKLCHLLFLFLTYLHLFACFWFMLTSTYEVYIPPGMYAYHHHNHLYDQSIWRQYAFSLYMSTYMLTAAEIGPRTPWECIFAGTAVLIGQLFQAFMFGEIAVVLFDLSSQRGKLLTIQEDIQTSMANMQLSRELRSRVIRFLLSMQGAILKQSEYQRFFEVLPPSLKHVVHAFLYQSVLTRNPALAAHSDIAREVLEFLNIRHCQPEEKIIVQGDPSSELYFVSHGKCEVELLDLHVPVTVKYLLKGSHFGEIGMIFNISRTATVKAFDYVTLAEMTRDDFDIVCGTYPKLRSVMRKSALRYNDPYKQFQLSTLRRCPYFRQLSDYVLTQLLYSLPLYSFDVNTCIIREAEHPQATYFLMDGEIDISMTVKDKQLAVLNMHPMGFFDQKSINKRKKAKTRMMEQSHRLPSGMSVRLVLDELGNGSVLAPVSPFLNEALHFEARTTRLTTMLVLSKTQFQSIRGENLKVMKAFNKFYSWIGLMRKTSITHIVALDYEKGPPMESPGRSITGKEKLKRIILGKLIEKRRLRQLGFGNTTSMANKLKAMAAKGEISDSVLLEKIRVGAAPESNNLLEAYMMLNISEVHNALLTQFAIHSAKVQNLIETAKERLQDTWKWAKKASREGAKVRAQLQEVKTMMELCVRMKGVQDLCS